MMKQLKDVYHNHMLNKNMVGNAAQAFIIEDTEAVFYSYKE